MHAVALSRTAEMINDPVEDGAGSDSARAAAETVRAKLADLGATPPQQSALVDAIDLILKGQVPRAEAALATAGFSERFIQTILPKLRAGLVPTA
ncbi:hypothetical protein [Rhodopseudomonas palustris]|nr:hypothetical protein [Rhodopseudomonas palustris]